ncbi:hypothetical protein BGLY_1419 [Bacillus glycinifermentans]|nr:hypothetical protein BGLY_1419 [Bacillus glycinifermentans]
MDSPHSRRSKHTRNIINHKTLIQFEEILLPPHLPLWRLRIS